MRRPIQDRGHLDPQQVRPLGETDHGNVGHPADKATLEFRLNCSRVTGDLIDSRDAGKRRDHVRQLEFLPLDDTALGCEAQQTSGGEIQ